MSILPIEAVYQDGVLRPSRPIDLAEGARVEIIVIPRASSPDPERTTPAEVAARIAAMPLQSSPEGFSGEDHDAILHGPDGSEDRNPCHPPGNLDIMEGSMIRPRESRGSRCQTRPTL